MLQGNHDISFDVANKDSLSSSFPHVASSISEETKALLTNCTYLEDSMVEIEGVRIWGSPWSPLTGKCAFKAQRGADIRQKVTHHIQHGHRHS